MNQAQMNAAITALVAMEKETLHLWKVLATGSMLTGYHSREPKHVDTEVVLHILSQIENYAGVAQRELLNDPYIRVVRDVINQQP